METWWVIRAGLFGLRWRGGAIGGDWTCDGSNPTPGNAA